MSEHEMILLRQFTETGDAGAFSEITRRYAGLVYGTCLRVTGSAECARDATQDTFFQLLKQAGKVTGSLGGWLHQVATRRAVDLVRRDKSRRERERAFAAGSAQETDAWAEVSPLVDEAMNEIEPGQRDLLLRHFLQGETTVQMAAADGVSQPTMSRRVEAALEQLRERLRKKGVKGVGVAAAVLGTMLTGTAQEAPAMVLAELGKMALAGAGTAGAGVGATISALKTAGAITAVVAVTGLSVWLVWRAVDGGENSRTAPARTTAGQPIAYGGFGGIAGARGPGGGAMLAGGAAGAGAVRDSGAVQGGWIPYSVQLPGGGVAMGGMAMRPTPTRATAEGALTLFADALGAAAQGRGDLARWEEHFVGTAETEAFRRLLENPETDSERELQKVLGSVGSPVEVVSTTAIEDGLRVKWKVSVRRPFTTMDNGVTKSWERGDRYEMELRVRQINGEWKLVGF